MKRVLGSAMASVVGFAALALVPGAAEAQGTRSPVSKPNSVSCPMGWRTANSNTRCDPMSGSAPLIYLAPSNNKCAAGYQLEKKWCVEAKRTSSSTSSSSSTASAPKRSASSSGSSSSSAGSGGLPRSAGLVLAKDNPQQLCPSGYRTSQDAKYCITLHEAAPATRARPASGCADNEVDEWGVWCTSRDTTLRYQQLENITISDFNYIYNALKKRPVPERDKYITPLMLAMGPPTPAPQAAASGPAPAASQTAAATTATAEAKPEKCKDGKGAAAGRALGGLMGGFGKKRSAAAAAEAVGAVADCID